MKKLFLLLSLLLPAQLSAQPEVYLETNAITANRISGATVSEVPILHFFMIGSRLVL